MTISSVDWDHRARSVLSFVPTNLCSLLLAKPISEKLLECWAVGLYSDEHCAADLLKIQEKLSKIARVLYIPNAKVMSNKNAKTKATQTHFKEKKQRTYVQEPESLTFELTLKNKYKSPKLETPVLRVNIAKTISSFGWKLQTKPNISKWEMEEIRKLVDIASNKVMSNWDDVALALKTGRTGYQCYVMLRTQVMTGESAGAMWNKKEIDILEGVISLFTENDQIPWGRVASSMLIRTKMQCYAKFLQLHDNTRMGRFLVEEDAVILSFVFNYGRTFYELASILFGRDRAELENRYILLRKLQYEGTWTVFEDTGLLYVLNEWPVNKNQTFQEVAYAAASENMSFVRTRSIESVMARLAELEAWKSNNKPDDLENGMRRHVWKKIKPKDELMTDFSLALNCLKYRMTVELLSFQEACITKKQNNVACQHSYEMTTK